MALKAGIDEQSKDSGQSLVHSLGIAFALYSVIPQPKLNFSAENRRRSILFFPLVGFVKGFTLIILALALSALGSLIFTEKIVHSAAFSLLLALALSFYQHAFSGFIHLDGYLDVHDALASRQSPARQLEIMADPHIGAFALIRAFFYLAGEVGLFFFLIYKAQLYGLFLTQANLAYAPKKALLYLVLAISAGSYTAFLYSFSGKSIYHLAKAKAEGMAQLICGREEKALTRLLYFESFLFISLASLSVYLLSSLIPFTSNPQDFGLLTAWAASQAKLALGLFWAGIACFYYLLDCLKLKWIKAKFGGITGDLAGHYLCQMQLFLLLIFALTL
ncbi:MAG: adenosylcobinamide-GDP ribazoletransferase [Eubacteriales bacterium]|nr:adenosylcobinamide-GDP ribazoletransferase [Eubacteriales bacterium]